MKVTPWSPWKDAQGRRAPALLTGPEWRSGVATVSAVWRDGETSNLPRKPGTCQFAELKVRTPSSRLCVLTCEVKAWTMWSLRYAHSTSCFTMFMKRSRIRHSEKMVLVCVCICMCVLCSICMHVCVCCRHICVGEYGKWRLTLTVFRSCLLTLFSEAGSLTESEVHPSNQDSGMLCLHSCALIL